LAVSQSTYLAEQAKQLQKELTNHTLVVKLKALNAAFNELKAQALRD
jgi:hypothetical protein